MRLDCDKFGKVWQFQVLSSELTASRTTHLMPVIKDLPGVLVPRNSEQESWLKAHVAKLCHMDYPRFPGSQPVSFGVRDLTKLENEDYWVCEKSDGVRVLFLIHTDVTTKDQTLYIIDRHNTYRQLSGIFFPHHADPMMPLRNTLIDGELVIDVDPRTKKETLRLLTFDCLVVDDQNVMSRPLDKRYGRLTEWFYKPYAQMMRDHPHMAASQPFDIKVKEITFSYHIEKVFAVDIPALQHDNDGLIYTCVNTPYTPGTDPNIMKWKPPSENSIDFKLVLRFPPMRNQPDKPDFHAKPIFLLYVWCGDERGVPKYEQYDEMYVEDDEWEKLKASREQIDDRIVEVHWDPVVSHWRMMRFRDDKPNGNHKSVVENIIQSIVDGVEKEALLARSNAIRNAWKARHGQPQSSSVPQHPLAQQYPHAQQHPPPSMRPPPPPLPKSGPPPVQQHPAAADLRYGPLAQSPWSKVSGPAVVAGMKR
ncbi:mRNA-capping enzyme subunit alpha [Hypsizygus marmoreus]|uniref:mRNA-capping enzyme subunit alpha n=1 Tax=Hypsizygus marmoreus TaxID=39966 RepID=A0A369JRE0_HYPMA|nr:mRNA-capping enzyme subunit alpha [Hypsizygus marmoreus]